MTDHLKIPVETYDEVVIYAILARNRGISWKQIEKDIEQQHGIRLARQSIISRLGNDILRSARESEAISLEAIRQKIGIAK